jgi:hypothetical protein
MQAITHLVQLLRRDRPHTLSRAKRNACQVSQVRVLGPWPQRFEDHYSAPLRLEVLEWTSVAFLSSLETTESTVAPPMPAPMRADDTDVCNP